MNKEDNYTLTAYLSSLVIIAFFLAWLLFFFLPSIACAETAFAYAETTIGGKVLLMQDPCPWNKHSREMIITGPTGAVIEVRSWTGTSLTWEESDYIIGFDGQMNAVTYPKKSFKVIPTAKRKNINYGTR